MITISTITPVYAGEAFLEDLVTEIETVRNRWEEIGAPMRLSEAIFVDDCSQDGSRGELEKIEHRYPWVRIVQLSRNFGQHRATVAGILHSSGDWVVTLDEDLQHRPFDIESMLCQAVSESADLVYATSAEASHGGSVRDFSSRVTKKVVGLMTGNPFVKHFNSYRLVRGTIARAAASVCSYGTFFDVALYWFTKNISLCKVELKDLRYIEKGDSGYSFRKLLSHARLLITTSETKIIRLAAVIGAVAMTVSVMVGLIIFVMKVLDPTSVAVKGWTSLFLSILFFSGLIVLQMGVALEYISILVMRAQGKPTFFVVDRSGDHHLRAYFES